VTLAALLLTGCFSAPEPAPQPKPPGTDARPEMPARPPGGPPDGVVTGMAPRLRSITVEPKTVTTLDDLTASAEAEDRDTPNVDLDFVWTINGQKRVDLASDHLSHDEFDKGDKLMVTVTASDGEHSVEKSSNEIVVQNSPPAFVGDPRATGQIDGLVLKGEDPDEDELSFSISGAPMGMTIDPQGGRIRYEGSEDEPGGHYNVSIQLSDGDGGTATWEFEVDVSPGSKAAEAAKAAEEAAAQGG